MPEPDTEALLRLAQLLRAPMPERVRFDITAWYSRKECGTAACAVGLAASDPWFMARGLHMEDGTPVFGRELSYGAASAFFGLSRTVAFLLFAGDKYPGWSFGNQENNYQTASAATAEMVAERIEAYVAGGYDELSALVCEQMAGEPEPEPTF